MELKDWNNTISADPLKNEPKGEQVKQVLKPYQVRMKAEYRQLCGRLVKLHRILVKREANTLDFELACPEYLLMDQERAMEQYKRILEIRAEYEHVDLYEDQEADF